jgi:hypothetical protein
MRFFDTGEMATGFIAVGQHATGVIAIGQHATGIIAIGQVARGCFTIGQLAFGFIGWGQVGFGLVHAVGMLGAGGRGLGIVLPLTPSLGKKRVVPSTVTYADIMHGNPGWLELDVAHDTQGVLGLYADGQRLPAKFDRKIARGVSQFAANAAQHVWCHLQREGQALICTRVVYVPPRPYMDQKWYFWGAMQFLALIGLAVAWWIFVGGDLLKLFES